MGEARALRERVLADLNERRQELERQIGELRAGRGKLVETYELVERALDARGARDGGGAVDAARGRRRRRRRPSARRRAPTRRPPAPSANAVTAAVPIAETASRRPSPSRESTEAATPTAPPESADDGRDVGALVREAPFEKLRPRTHDDTARAGAAIRDAPSSRSSRPSHRDDDRAAADAGVDGRAEADDEAATGVDEAGRRRPGRVAARTPPSRRSPTTSRTGPSARCRTSRTTCSTACAASGARSTSARCCPPPTSSSPGGRTCSSRPSTRRTRPAPPRWRRRRWRRRRGAVPGALLTELATIGGHAAPHPPRQRRSSRSTPAVAGRRRDRDRPAPRRPVPRVAGPSSSKACSATCSRAAYARGVYDAAPDGARLRWVPAGSGKCPDCDDNALEPTVKGSDFPTGQPHPPAHPGCRCLAGRSDALTPLARAPPGRDRAT